MSDAHPASMVVGHGASLVAIVLSWTGVLQPIVALLATLAAVVWYAVQVYESKFVQKHIRVHRSRRRRRRKGATHVQHHQGSRGSGHRRRD